MEIILENQRLRVTVDTLGAEITSIIYKETSRECVWPGDAAWWKRHTPVLFPIVGALWDGTARIDGKEYRMSQHGFARDMEFSVMEHTSDSATFVLESNDATRALYPYSFRLHITHSITEEGSVTTAWRVENAGTGEMHFQIGGHPAYMVPDIDPEAPASGSLSLTGQGIYAITKIGAKGCVKSGETPLTADEIILRPDTFAGDAIIFEQPCPRKVEMYDRHGRSVLTFRSECPALGIWAPCKGEHAPFVCIEPWWGRTDREDYAGGFADKEYMQHLNAGESARGSWEVIFHG